jgi:hypothetical protein
MSIDPTPSPLDQIHTADRLAARVVDPGPPRRILGYDVEGDLARHYGFAELLLLLASGELADPAAARALDVALAFLAPTDVGEAPGHAAVLSRVCDVPFRATLAIGALALAEEAGFTLAEHAAWLAWLAVPAPQRNNPPPAFLAATDEDGAAVGRLRSALEAIPFRVAALEVKPSRIAALLAVLAACGLGPDAMALVWMVARLPAVAAEAAARPPLGVSEYPSNLPAVEYREDP